MESRKAMCPVPVGEEKASGAALSQDTPVAWSAKAERRLTRVPEGFMRDMTKQRVEAFARKNGIDRVTLVLVEEKYAEWAAGSEKRRSDMEWDDDAAARIARIPDFIRPMVVQEIERCARDLGLSLVTGAAIDKAGEAWEGRGSFHSKDAPNQYKV